MPWYKNTQPRVIGLSYKAENSPRLIQPDQVFEAKEEEIPKYYLEQKWFEPAEAPKQTTTTTTTGGDAPKTPPDPSSATAQTGSGQMTGPEPVQGSGTSMLESTTDKEAAESGAYDRGDHTKRRK